MEKLVYLTSRFPNPAIKGDQLRAYFQLMTLSKKYEVTLISFSKKAIPEENLTVFKQEGITVINHVIPMVSRLFSLISALFGQTPFQVAYFYNGRVNKKVQAKIKKIAPDIIHAHLIRVAAYAQFNNTRIRSLDYMDAMGVGMDKQARGTKNPLKKWFCKIEARRLYKYESLVFPLFNQHQIISAQDAEGIAHKSFKMIKIVPNGVDFDQFYPKKTEKRYDIVFMGNMNYPPNIHAAHYIIEKIGPLLIEKWPQIKILIAGRKAPKSILKRENKNIEVIQNYADISQAIAESRIMIAPMFMSIGLQNKILQAMAMKVPCITTPSANNAINAKQGVEIMVADKPEGFVQKISLLLNDQLYSNQIAENAYRFVLNNFKWKETTNKLFE